MAPWLLAGFFLAFICSYLLSERWIRRHLGGRGWLPIMKASFMGLPLPICSCGVLLVALALRRSGARKAPVCAFLASTPQSGTDALLVSLPLLGPCFTLLRMLGAVISGIATGAFVRWFGIHTTPVNAPEDLTENCAAVCACHHHDASHPHNHHEDHHHEFVTHAERLRDALRYAFIHLPGEIALLLTIGVALAAAIAVFLPANLLSGLSLVLTYLLAIVIGLPTYACSLAIVPVAMGLIASGLTPGAAFLFMACAPTTHLGAILVLGKELGWRTVLLYIAAIILTGIAFALVIDLVLELQIPSLAMEQGCCHHHHHHHHDSSLWTSLSIILVTLLFTHGLCYRCMKWFVNKRKH